MNWLCFQTNAKKEFIAFQSLRSSGFEVILPYYMKIVKHARKQITKPYPIFPSYGFLLYDGDKSLLYKIKYTRGIKDYLKFENGEPQIVPQNIIDTIKSLKQNDGTYILDPNRLKPGDDVIINNGVFKGLKAVFGENIDQKRSELLVNLLGRIHKIKINTNYIEK